MAMVPLARCIIIRYRKSSAHRIQTNPSETARSIYPLLLPLLETLPQITGPLNLNPDQNLMALMEALAYLH
jgi:hypothetical protein